MIEQEHYTPKELEPVMIGTEELRRMKKGRIPEQELIEQELRKQIEHLLYECNTPRIGYQTASTLLLALIKEALPELAKEAGYEKPQTLADLKAHARKRPDLIITDD